MKNFIIAMICFATMATAASAQMSVLDRMDNRMVEQKRRFDVYWNYVRTPNLDFSKVVDEARIRGEFQRRQYPTVTRPFSQRPNRTVEKMQCKPNHNYNHGRHHNNHHNNHHYNHYTPRPSVVVQPQFVYPNPYAPRPYGPSPYVPYQPHYQPQGPRIQLGVDSHGHFTYGFTFGF
jgi:hypothetical protein